MPESNGLFAQRTGTMRATVPDQVATYSSPAVSTPKLFICPIPARSSNQSG